MSRLVVRRLLIDLEKPMDRHWCGNDAFRTALFNALSMSFPVGEQFFIDSVRNGFKALPAQLQEKFKEEVHGFIGQEATHRRIHGLYNQHLERQGLINHWAPRALGRLKLLDGLDPRHALAATAANEHFTAVLAEWMLRNPDLLGGGDQRLANLWLWHSAEESEHRCTAFDVYQAAGGSHEWRVRWFRRVSIIFLTDVVRQTLSNLRQDGTLWQGRTWRSAAGFLFGQRGLVRFAWPLLAEYRRADFHPSQRSDALGREWLATHHDLYNAV